jgi:hypothetical protein
MYPLVELHYGEVWLDDISENFNRSTRSGGKIVPAVSGV